MGTAKTNPKSDETNDEDVRKKLHSLLEHSRTVMFLSSDGTAIHGRPMALIRVDPDETMYFTTDTHSDKLKAITARPQVSISVQDLSGFALLQGLARVSRERSLIDELWEDSWKIWYPKGKSDPEIAVIVVVPARATLWDQSIGKGLSYLFRYVKARISGEAMEIEPSDQAEVELGGSR